MSGTGVIILRDTASPLLRRLQSAVNPAGLSIIVGRAERNLVRDHLFQKNRERHKAGGRNYYTQAGRSARVTTVGTTMILSINQVGFRQRLQGGRIKPGAGKKYLTIADPGMAGYGKRAPDFSDLDFGSAINPKTGRMQKALIRRASTSLRYSRRKRKDGSISTSVRPGAVQLAEPVFWLVRSVNQKPDRSVLPSDRQILRTAETAISTRLNRLGGAQ